MTILLASAAAGAVLTHFGSRAAPAGSPASAGPDLEPAPSALALQAELERLRKTKIRLELALERARRSIDSDRSGALSRKTPLPREPQPFSEEEWRTLRERALAAREALATLDSDPELARFHARHSREENAFPRWSARRFLSDPAINPARIQLSKEERREFERLYARAYLRMKRMDLERQLVMTEGALIRVEKQLASGDAGPPRPPPAEAHFVHVPTNLTIVLPREDYPEIDLLQDEIEATVIDWFHEARDFLAGLGS